MLFRSQGKRSGRIITEGGASAEEMRLANTILKYFESSTKEAFLLNQMLFNGCTTGCPQVLWFDYAKSPEMDQIAGLIMDALRFDTFALAPFNMADGSDCREIIRMKRCSDAELIEENPDQEDVITRHYGLVKEDKLDVSAIIKQTAGMSIEDARFLEYNVIAGLCDSNRDGRRLVLERLYPVIVDAKVAISMDAEGDSELDYQILPPKWTEKRTREWQAQNPQYKISNHKINALWMTRWTREGVILQNKMHWFQETTDKGEPILPIAVFVPQIIDGVPSGPGPDDSPLVLMKAISETEALHDIRCGSGDVLAYMRGSVVNFEEIPTELSIGNGIMQLDPTHAPGGIDANLKFLTRNPNQNYLKYAEKTEQELDKTDLINRGIQGQSVTNQSGIAKQTEIARAIVGYSIIVDNFNQTYQRVKNMECLLVPYVFTEDQTIQLADDDKQQSEQVTVNQTEYDLSGKPKVVANDLSSVKWRWRLVPGDDSLTARQQELNEMLIFWNTAAPALIAQDETLATLASVMKSMSNRTAKEIGKMIEEKANVKAQQLSQQQMMTVMSDMQLKQAKAQAEMKKADKFGYAFSIKPEDLRMYPEVYQMMVGAGFINTANGNKFQLPSQGQPMPAQAEQIPQQAPQQVPEQSAAAIQQPMDMMA